MRAQETMNAQSGLTRMLTGLLDKSHLTALDRVPSLIGEYAPQAGLHDVLIYLADLQENVLRLLPGHGAGGDGEPPEEIAELRIDGTLAGRAFQEVRILSRPGGDGRTGWWVPLLDGTERLGVLRISTRDSDQVPRDDMLALASLVALLVVSKRVHSDSYARLVRTRPMNVAAEMQWNLMPPMTFATPEMVVDAALEPAYEIGGDAFDYAVAGETVYLAVFDAMGHDVAAGLASNLAVAACRNNRRQGVGLVDTSEAAERVLIEQFGRATRFVTAILAELDVSTGMLSWVNRGHHPPVLIRGGRWIATLECPPAHPLGLDLGIPVTLCHRQLEPGDRVLLYTDGITEARHASGPEFGLDHFIDFVIRHNADGLPVPETLRRLIRHVLDYHQGRLQDDATVLLVEWHGSAARRMTVS